MARRRYISTKISTDAAVNRLASSGGDFAVMLYTWMIPHAQDDATLTGDPDELLMTVIPGRRDKSAEDVAAALEAMQGAGLIVWDGATVWFPSESFYGYQTYIKAENRRQTPNPGTNAGKRRKTPENASSVTPSVTPSPSVRETASSTPRGQRAVVSGSPWSVLVAFLEAIGADPAASMAPAWKNKQLAIAKRMIEQGYAEDAVRRCAGYMLSQDWRTAPFDLIDLERYIGKWETAGQPEREAPRKSGRTDANQRTRDEHARNLAIAEATLGTGRA